MDFRSAISISYGASTAPVAAATYAVVATAENANFTGTSSDSLVIDNATATVILGDVNPSYDGKSKQASVTTIPAGLSYSVMRTGHRPRWVMPIPMPTMTATA